MLGRLVALVTIWAVALVVLFWGRLPSRWRRVFALFTSALGVVFLLLALNSEGSRESATVGSFLMGSPYVAGKVSAAASLPYYVVTGVLFALGFLGLAAGDTLAISLSQRYFLNAVVLSWAVTALRVVLEKAAAPEGWSYLVGIVWLPPVVGAYFALSLHREGRGFKDLVLYLLGYALAVRGAVALLMIVASSFRLGTHYDVSQVTDVAFMGRSYTFEPQSARGILTLTFFSQLFFWPIVTIVSGLIGAGVARLLAWASRKESIPPRGISETLLVLAATARILNP
jgi:hypothetical protein